MRGSIDGVPFELDETSLRVDEAEALERALGMSFKKWGEQLGEGSITALRGLLWIIRRRETPGVRFDDPTLGQVPLASIVIDDEPETVEDPTVAEVA